MGIFTRKPKVEQTTVDGVPITIEIGGESAKYEWNSVAEMYDNCPYIRAIIDYKASCVANGKLVLKQDKKDSKDEIVLSSPYLDLLSNPNPLQSFQSLMAQTMIYESLYSKSFLRGVKGMSSGYKNSRAIWSLPPSEVEVQYKNNDLVDLYSKFRLEDIIDYYEFNSNASISKLYNEEILYSSDYTLGFIDTVSDFETLQQSVANLMYIQESRGVIIRNRGALGMLSQSSGNKDQAGVIPLEPEDKINIQESYRKLYGIKPSQSSIIIPDLPMTWQSMITNIKELQLSEQSLEEFNICCDMLGVPRSIFDDKTSFDNQSEVKKRLYTDTIIPYANNKANLLTRKFELKGQYFCIDYSHVDALQDDQKQKQETEKINTEKLSIQYKDGVISKGTYLEKCGYKEIDKSFYNIYYNEQGTGI